MADDLPIDELTIQEPPVVIAALGFPGSGKSTLLRALDYILNSLEKDSSVWINQDRVGDAIAYSQALTEACESGKKFVLADKCHHTLQIRNYLRQVVGKSTIIWLKMFSAQDPPGSTGVTVEICLRRIRERENRHLTLTTEDSVKAVKGTFQKYYSPIQVSEISSDEDILQLNISLSLLNNLQVVIDYLVKDMKVIKQPDPALLRVALQKAKAYELSLKPLGK